MSPWVESLGVLILIAGGALLGVWFSRRSAPWWTLGFFIPFALVIAFALANYHPALGFTPPLSWLMSGRNKFAVTGFIATMVLTTPMMKMPKLRIRVGVGVVTGLLAFQTSLWPFLAPAFNQRELASLVTRIDRDGVCLQNTAYTCGPAAAVTALRRLGYQAEESELALLAHTSSAMGTPPDILASVLKTRYGSDGLICDYCLFHNLAELKAAGLTLAVVKYSFFVDHYVTVLEVNDQAVIVGDPLNGRTELSRAEFEEQWRFCGVTLERH